MTIWDRLFKLDLEDGDSGIAIHGFGSLISAYARGEVTRAQLGATIKDGAGNAVPADELVQAAVLLDLIDAAADKTVKADQIRDALFLVELRWITKAQAKAKLGV